MYVPLRFQVSMVRLTRHIRSHLSRVKTQTDHISELIEVSRTNFHPSNRVDRNDMESIGKNTIMTRICMRNLLIYNNNNRESIATLNTRQLSPFP